MAHQHENRDRHHHDNHAKPSGGIQPRHKVMFTVALVLAVIALAIYVMSENEAVQPGGLEPSVPAAP